MTFTELGLRPEILSALETLGFESPTPIQEQAVPKLIENDCDFVGMARTGTGKTAAFGLPLLHGIEKKRAIQGVVLCPTRELCMQITRDFVRFGAKIPGLSVVAVYGGAGIVPQIKGIKAGCQVVVATPGRFIDLMNRGVMDLSTVRTLILDEADEMLQMGFTDDINAILEKLPEERKTWMFSATLPREVARIVEKHLTDPERVKVSTPEVTDGKITHSAHVVEERHRQEALFRVLDANPDFHGLVFCRTRKDTRELGETLLAAGYPAEAIHGDLAQTQRSTVMRHFRNGTVRILVATDVAARGIDVNDLTHVIHYHMPDDLEVYTHRSGRTGRAGKDGDSIVLASPREMWRVRELGRRLKVEFKIKRLPDAEALCQVMVDGYMKRLAQEASAEERMAPFVEFAMTALEDLDRETLVRRLLALELGARAERYAGGVDINARIPERGKGTYTSSLPRERVERMFVNVGRLDKVAERDVRKLVADKAGIPMRFIGRVDLKREFSFFELDRGQVHRVRTRVRDILFQGRKVSVRKAGAPRKPRPGFQKPRPDQAGQTS